MANHDKMLHLAIKITKFILLPILCTADITSIGFNLIMLYLHTSLFLCCNHLNNSFPPKFSLLPSFLLSQLLRFKMFQITVEVCFHKNFTIIPLQNLLLPTCNAESKKSLHLKKKKLFLPYIYILFYCNDK